MKSIFAALALSACTSAPVYANEAKCYDSVEFKKHMEKAGNDRVFSGLSYDLSHILEIWVAPTGEWAAFITTPANVTCQANYGYHYVGPLPNA